MKSQTNARAAFTLVELLVVIAIVGLLVALLIPAVQAARESARRVECANKMRQIGIATHNFESSKGRLPAGAYWGGADADHMRQGNILVRLLPFLEQQAIYDAFDLSADDIHDQTMPSGEPLVNVKMPMFSCPSAKALTEGWFGDLEYSNYAASVGSTAVDNNRYPCPFVDHWNASALSIYHDWDDTILFSGPFCRRGIELPLRKIIDGVSKTIFFGEVRADCARHVQTGWLSTFNGNGTSTTVVPINWDSCHEGHENRCYATNNWNTQYGFKSYHPGGGQFMLGDNSVHFFTEEIDYMTYQYLGEKDDGQQIQIP